MVVRENKKPSIKTRAKHYIYSLGVVRNYLNREAASLCRRDPPKLTALENNIVDDLAKEGIFATDITTFVSDKHLPENIEKFYAAAPSRVGGVKSFLKFIGGSISEIDLENPLCRIALDEKILSIVASYFGAWPKLNYFNLTETMPAHAEPIASQKWHRDPGMGKILKLFIYLTEVDDIGAGPFTYVKGTPNAGKYGKIIPKESFGAFSYYPQKHFYEPFLKGHPPTPMLGKKGTLIFCDTTGLHFGGLSKTKRRLMATIFYHPHAEMKKPNLKYKGDLGKLPPIAKFAISLPN
jgi:hypothetical protein